MKLFHKHDWYQTGFEHTVDKTRNIRYSIRIYRCKACGKLIKRDGRRPAPKRTLGMGGTPDVKQTPVH